MIYQMTLALSLPFSNPSLLSLSSYHRHRIFKPPRASSQISVDSPPSLQLKKTGVIIVGAGLAGLAAATRLSSENIPFLLLDASDAVGGRVRTDFVDGFLLDRGFQIFITAYPEARRLLDYETLDLHRFYSGAQVYYDGRFHTVADPIRHFTDSLQTLTNPIGTIVDKFLVALTRIRVLIRSDGEILSSDEVSTLDLLRRIGFSDSIVDRFFRPFFGGIFFDRDLETTSRLFDFIFKCLSLGENTLPAKGISAIPEQLASKLPSKSILLKSRVVSIDFESDSAILTLQSGEVLRSELGVIVAVEQPEAVKLLAGKLNRELVQKKPVRSTVCLYFSADPNQIPVQDPVLFLNGSGRGIVNNMFFATNVAPSYGPHGKALVSVSLIGLFEDREDKDLTAEVVRELSGWFGESVVGSWRHLRTYQIGFAQPNQSPPWRLAVVMIAVQPLIIVCYYCKRVLLKSMSKKAIKAQNESSKLAAEAVSNLRTVTAFSSQARILQMLENAQEGPQRESIRQSWFAGIGLGTSQSLMSCTWALDFWYGGKLISQGYITAKALFETFMILVSTGRVIADAGTMTNDLAKGSDAVGSVFAVLDRYTGIEPDDPEGHQPNKITGHVELREVQFAYPARPDVMIFNGFSINIESGKSTALVGQSGSGKSTIIGLIERFYDPLGGVVKIDGRDIRTFHLRSLRKHIALVSQEPTLFAGTIRENITYGASDKTDETEIIEAAKAANAHDFIAGLKDGYDTWCGDRGLQLSGGQKQRVAIARAILKNPAILLLDEATSALDSQSEKVVQDALERVMVGRTSVVVAHRLSTIQNCDTIAVLDKGTVVERGTHSSLLGKGPNGAYYSLVSLQRRPHTV